MAIPLLALIPLLGQAKAAAETGLPWDAVFKAVGMIAIVVIGGRLVLRQLFRVAAWTQMGEVFTATALLVVVGTAWLMQVAGLSMGLGAFLAGVLLADSEFRHELESQIEPFKGLLLGLFFIAVGMSIDLVKVAAEPGVIALGVLGLVLAKASILVLVGWRPGRLPAREALMLGAVLALGGEFAFVVFSEAFKAGLIDDRLARPAGRDRRPDHGGDAAAGAGDRALPARTPGRENRARRGPDRPREPAGDHRRLRPHGPDRRPHAACAEDPVHRARAQTPTRSSCRAVSAR